MTRVSPRVGLLGFFHESNSFAAGRVDEQQVRARRLDGDAILAEHAGSGTTIAGYVDAAAELDWDLVPMTYIELVPSAPLDSAAGDLVLRMLRTALRAELSANGDFDMLVVAAHGAAVSTGEHDLDGAILEMLREELGADIPIGVTLDLHANVSARMVSCSDVLVGYRSNPHVDPRERGREVGELLHRSWSSGIRPAAVLRTVPALMGILTQGTSDQPWATFADAAERLRHTPGILAVSLFQGFPWSDVAEAGMSIVVLTDPGQANLDAAHAAEELATLIWSRREEFRRSPLAPADALAAADPARCTLVLDVGDNIGAGGSGARTELLAAAVALGRSSFVAIVCDAAAASIAHAAGIGVVRDLSLGEQAFPVQARVTALSDGRYEDAGPTHVGHRHFDAGPSAVLTLSTGQTVVVASRAILPSSPEQLRHLGVEPRDFEIVAAKGVHSPLAGYLPVVDGMLFADTAGATADDFTRLPYRHRPRPLFPIDSDLTAHTENESAHA